MDYNCSCVSIVAQTTSKVFLIDGKELKGLFETEKHIMDNTSDIYRHLFLQIYSQYLDSYRLTVKERYTQLLRRCPQIVQQINLKDDTAMAKGERLFWVLPVEKVGRQICKAIRLKKSKVYVTKRWHVLAVINKNLPFALYKRM